MARMIYKYSITPDTLTPMPQGAKLLDIQMQRDTVALWAEVDPDAYMVHRDIGIYGTGHPLPDSDTERGLYITTFQMGAFVWHAYDRGEC